MSIANKTEHEKIADLLYPNNKLTVEEIEKIYPKRDLAPGQVVSRYAPSPTGFMHVGNFFQMFIAYNLVRVTDGVMFLRVEDTDSKREKKEALGVIYEILRKFGIKFNEYQTLDGVDIGAYGPYIQSKRTEIYKAYAKKLVQKGKAFPCFCKKTEGIEEIKAERAIKFAKDDEKEYDPCRNLSFDEVKAHIDAGDSFAIRLKTKNDGTQRIKFNDLIKGEIESNANAKDFILVKSDGIPPYAFAHAIDDTLMGTTIVVRGEEYISSVPAHLELFDALGFKRPIYCHNPLICKIDEEGNRRKISKRRDPEADMRFYFEQGIPTEAICEYLLNIINSGFETWRAQNPTLPWTDFKFSVNDITAVAPIFDLVKLNDVSKNFISRLTTDEVFNRALAWADEYDKDFAKVLRNNEATARAVFSIERGTERPRKDISKFSDIKNIYSYMFDETAKTAKWSDFGEKIDQKTIKTFISTYLDAYNHADTKDEWFARVKEVARHCGFGDNKEYKANPTAFKGNIGDACAILRVALTCSNTTPDLYTIMQILGEPRIRTRLSRYIK